MCRCLKVYQIQTIVHTTFNLLKTLRCYKDVLIIVHLCVVQHMSDWCTVSGQDIHISRQLSFTPNYHDLQNGLRTTGKAVMQNLWFSATVKCHVTNFTIHILLPIFYVEVKKRSHHTNWLFNWRYVALVVVLWRPALSSSSASSSSASVTALRWEPVNVHV